MINYQLGKIYKIECYTTGKVYIGSTCEPLISRRLAKHKEEYKQYTMGNYKSKSRAFEVLEHNTFSISLIEKFPCANKDELSARENFYVSSTDCVNKTKYLGKTPLLVQ